MTDERKYHDDEVERIFELASNTAETGRPVLSGDAGLTLAEIQDVGREVLLLYKRQVGYSLLQ